MKKLRMYTTMELIDMAIEAEEKGKTSAEKFKEYFGVNFTFLQACNLLTQRKIWNNTAMDYNEYELIKGDVDRERKLSVLRSVKARNTRTVFDDF